MQHALQLTNGETIHYQLSRRQRRTIGFKVSQDGLVVHAPLRLSQAMIETIIQQKTRWISEKLTDLKRHMPAPVAWQTGESLWLLGNIFQLEIQPNTQNKQPTFADGVLLLQQPHDHEELIAHKVKQWYKKQAVTDFSRRIALFAAKLGVQVPKLLLSNAKSRWGSCNSKQEIRLNWRLLQAPPHLINYVVCHELAHLKEMNHSMQFWQVVASLYPEYKKAERELKQWSPQLHRI